MRVSGKDHWRQRTPLVQRPTVGGASLALAPSCRVAGTEKEGRVNTGLPQPGKPLESLGGQEHDLIFIFRRKTEVSRPVRSCCNSPGKGRWGLDSSGSVDKREVDGF